MSGATIGIDLGTTNSVVAIARDGGVEVLDDGAGHHLHPSVVSFLPNGETVVGVEAKLRRVIDPRNTVFSTKRLIGQAFGSPAAQAAIAQLPYRVVEGPEQEPVIETRAGQHTATEIATMILLHLRHLAELKLNQRVSECVITVPANFSDSQREATRRAGEAAGMTVIRVLNEPTAAALAYGVDKHVDQRIVVFDMGGGTTDVTLLAVRESFLEVLATGGEPFLGGDDMDHTLADLLADEFLAQHRIDLRAQPDRFALLRIAAEQVKSKLSQQAEVSGTLKDLAHGAGGDALGLSFWITRERFESRITPLVERALIACENVLAEAGVSPDHIDDIILVGGATRVPLVRRRIAEHFGREPRTDIHPMQIVAQGAALHARSLSAAIDDLAPPQVLIDVTPHALGLAIAGAYTDVLIDKNEAIPAERTRVFTTTHDGQEEVALRVCQGAERVFGANQPVGTLRLSGLRPARRGDVKIEVTFLVDADGILQVSAKDVATGRSERATLRMVGLGERA
jgi:molecular chaperone DnaK